MLPRCVNRAEARFCEGRCENGVNRAKARFCETRREGRPEGRVRTRIGWAIVLAVAASAAVAAAEHRGQVRFSDVPVHGATVQATQADKTFRVLTDPEGRYVLSDLTDGTWTIQVEMPGFETIRKDVKIPEDTAAVDWALKMRP